MILPSFLTATWKLPYMPTRINHVLSKLVNKLASNQANRASHTWWSSPNEYAQQHTQELHTDFG